MSEVVDGSLIDGYSRRVYSILGREFTGQILYLLRRQPFQSASELARIMSVHIATAQKYLEELRDLKLVSSRNRQEPSRPVEEYYLSFKRLDLTLDTSSFESNAIKEMTKQSDIMVRELADISVAYEVDHKNERIQRVLFLDKSMRRRVNVSVDLSYVEGKIVWHIPFPSEDVRPIATVLERAGLNHLEEDEIMGAIHHLRRIGLIEVSCKGGEQ
jgi:hypothetical protein